SGFNGSFVRNDGLMHLPEKIGDLRLLFAIERGYLEVCDVSPGRARVLNSSGAGYRMFDERRRMNDPDEKPRIDTFLRTENQKLGRADSGVRGQHRLVEIRTQLSVENITCSEQIL